MQLQSSGFWFNHPLNQADFLIKQKANGAVMEVVELKRYIPIIIIIALYFK